MQILYVTSNQNKFRYGVRRLEKYELDLVQETMDFVEIQSESIEEIARHKGVQAFELLKKPLLVNDSGWNIPALNGFPGPYMSYIENWFEAEIFLDLMRSVDDRKIILTEVLCYVDEERSMAFESSIEGTILTEMWTGTAEKTLDRLISFRGDGMSLGECREKDVAILDRDLKYWDDFAKWYGENVGSE